MSALRVQCVWVCHSPEVSTLTGSDIRVHTHSSLRSSDVVPLGPPTTTRRAGVGAEQQGAQERCRPGEHNADQRKAHLQVPSVMLWSGIKLLISLTHPLNPSVTHSLTHPVGHPLAPSLNQSLTYRSFTHSLCNNTNKQFNKAIGKGSSRYKTKKKKTAPCLLQVPHLIFCWCGAACWSWSLWASPISQSSISLAIKASRIMWRQCVGARCHTSRTTFKHK